VTRGEEHVQFLLNAFGLQYLRFLILKRSNLSIISLADRAPGSSCGCLSNKKAYIYERCWQSHLFVCQHEEVSTTKVFIVQDLK
jgi:hypothetical protein